MKVSAVTKSNIFFIIVLLLGCGVYYMAVVRHRALPKLLSYYTDTFFLTTKDFSYQKVEPALFERALIFYNVHFPGISVPHRVARMQVFEELGRLNIIFDGIKVDTMRAVQSLHADQIEQIMRSYIPFESVMTYPFESLILAGIKQTDIRLHLIFEPISSEQVYIQGQIFDRKVADIQFSMKVQNLRDLNPLHFVFGSPILIQFSLKDKGGIEKYNIYAREAGIEPMNFDPSKTETIESSTPFSDILK